MTTKLYFENVKSGKRYELLALDKEKHEVTLRAGGAKFTEAYSKERFEKLGYRLVKVEEPSGEDADDDV